MNIKSKEKINIFVVIYFTTLLTVWSYKVLNFRFILSSPKIFCLISYTIISIVGACGIYSIIDTKLKNYILILLPMLNILLLDLWLLFVIFSLVPIVFTRKLIAPKSLKIVLRMIYAFNTLIVIVYLILSPVLMFSQFIAKDVEYINAYSPDNKYLIRGYYSDLGATGPRYETYVDLEKVYFGIVTKYEKRLYEGEPYDEPDAEWINSQTIRIGDRMLYLNK